MTCNGLIQSSYLTEYKRDVILITLDLTFSCQATLLRIPGITYGSQATLLIMSTEDMTINSAKIGRNKEVVCQGETRKRSSGKVIAQGCNYFYCTDWQEFYDQRTSPAVDVMIVIMS